jgi:hypothetical protein
MIADVRDCALVSRILIGLPEARVGLGQADEEITILRRGRQLHTEEPP